MKTVLLFLLLSFPCLATFSYVSGSAAQSSNVTSATTLPINTSGANLLVIEVSTFGSSFTLMDSLTGCASPCNTLLLTGQTVGGGGSILLSIYYVLNPTVGANHVFSVSGIFPSLVVHAFSGALAFGGMGYSRFEYNSATSTTSLSAGTNVIPTVNNCLVITALVTDSVISSQAAPGFTVPYSNAGAGSLAIGGSMGYMIQTTATPETPIWTWTTSADAGVVSFFFTPSAGPTVGAKRRILY